MLKKLVVLIVVGAVVAFAAAGPLPVPKELSAAKLYVPPSSDPYGSASDATKTLQAAPATAGEQAGTTTYDYQQNGAMGNRVMIDGDGNAHVCWMFSADQSTGNFADRAVHYNFFDAASGEFVFASPVKASGTYRAGYTTLGVMPDGRAVVAFHDDPDGDGTQQSEIVVDAGAGLGAFSSPVAVDIVSETYYQPIWPHVAVGSDGTIHVAAHPHIGDNTTDPGDAYYKMYYSRSTDDGASFSSWKPFLTANGGDAGIAVSKDGNKVALVCVNGVPVTDMDHPSGMGNVYVIESTNKGSSWGTPLNITDGRYADEVEIVESTAWLFANPGDLDCAYDNDGNLHVLFEEGMWVEQTSTTSPGGHGSAHYYGMWGRVMHWDSESNDITQVSGPYTNCYPDDTTFAPYGFWGFPGDPGGDSDCGAVDPQLTIWGDNIIATWAGQWDTTDLSGAGTINGDLYAAISTNGGANWKPLNNWGPSDTGTVWAHVTNLTETHAPGAGVGATPDESYHTVYPWVDTDSTLHITYIEDLFSGSCVATDAGSTGIYTINPVRYWTGFKAAVGAYTGGAVDENPVAKTSLIEVVGQNPTNNVSFNVDAPNTRVTLKIYDVAGNLIETVFDGNLGNTRTLNWNSENVATGVYFYSFVTPSGNSSGRVVVVH